MVLKKDVGCPAASSWILPSSQPFTAVTRTGLVDRLEAFLEGGALSQSLSVSMCFVSMCVSVRVGVFVGVGSAPVPNLAHLIPVPQSPHLPAIYSSPVYKCLVFRRRDARSLLYIQCVVRF